METTWKDSPGQGEMEIEILLVAYAPGGAMDQR